MGSHVFAQGVEQPMDESSEPQAAPTGNDGTTENGNKRSEPPVSEKLSPEKKVSRTESPTAATGDSSVKKTLDFENVPLTEGANDSKPAGTGGTTDANNAELLALAMQKISALEAKLNVAMSARPAPPSKAGVNVTPPPSRASVTSPAPTSSAPKSSTADDDGEHGGDDHGGDEGPGETEGDDMIVMPSGKKVSCLYLNIKMSKVAKKYVLHLGIMLASKYIQVQGCIYSLNKKQPSYECLGDVARCLANASS